MNKLLGTALVATTLSMATHAAFAEEVRESRPVDAKVTRVKLGGVVELVVHQGATPSLMISGDKEDVARLITIQHGDTLEIESEKRLKNVRLGWRSEKTRAELTVPNLEEFASQGVGSSTITGFAGEKMTLTLDGAGSVTLNGNYRNVNASLGGVGTLTLDAGKSDRIEVRLGGTGSMTLTGQTKNLYGRLGGVGSLSAGELRAESVDLRLSGIGSAKVFATSSAVIDLSGMGSATVYGNPANRRANSSGLGKVHWD